MKISKIISIIADVDYYYDPPSYFEFKIFKWRRQHNFKYYEKKNVYIV